MSQIIVNSIDDYIVWINHIENLDELTIFKHAIHSNNWDVAKLAVLRGILFSINPEYIQSWFYNFPKNLQEIIADHYLCHIQQKYDPIQICPFLDKFIHENHLSELHLINYTFRYILNGGYSNNLSILDCKNIYIHDLPDNLNLRVLKARVGPDNSGLIMPNLEVLYLQGSCFLSQYNFPKLVKLTLIITVEVHRQSIHQMMLNKCTNLKKIKLKNFIIMSNFQILRRLTHLKLVDCELHADLRVDNIHLKRCKNEYHYYRQNCCFFSVYNSIAHISCNTVTLKKCYYIPMENISYRKIIRN